MKNLKVVLFGLLLVAAGSAFGQGWSVNFIYVPDGSGTDNPLGCPCTGGTAFADGVAIGLFWDNDGNGPDADDPQPAVGDGVGQVQPTNTITFNGVAQEVGPGYFAAEFSIVMLQIPETNNQYFLKVNGGTCCVTSALITATAGAVDKLWDGSEWTCAAGSCGGGNPPNAPTNVNASDDTRCLRVNVAWNHDGQNVSGFTIRANGEQVATVDAATRNQDILWPHDQVTDFSVEAFNVAGASAAVHDNGSTYQMRYSSATRNAIQGLLHSGDSLHCNFDMPVDPGECPSGWWLTLWYNTSGQWTRYGIIARDSLSDESWIYWPDQALVNCRLVLTDSSFLQPLGVLSDTSNLFQLVLSADDERGVMPTEYRLAQNFPNPFNPTTTIEFSVPNAADVSLQVFNIQGQLVRTLVSARLSAGVHHVEWDGLTDSGTAVGTGLYLYRMVANDFVATQKMILMK